MTDSLLINFNLHQPRPSHPHLTRAASASASTLPTLQSLARPPFLHSHSSSAAPYTRPSPYSSESGSKPNSGSSSGSGGEAELGGAGGRGGKRRYECLEPECGKTFSTSGHRSRHHKIHKGEAEKRWACPFPGCTSKFTRKDNQTQHYKTHFPRAAKPPRSLKLIGRAKTYPSAAGATATSIPSSESDQMAVVPPTPGLMEPITPSPLVSPAVAPAPEALAPLGSALLVPNTPLSGPASGFSFGSPGFPQFPTPPGMSETMDGLHSGVDGVTRIVKQPGSAGHEQFATQLPSAAALTPQFAPPPNSPPPWLRVKHEALSPIHTSHPAGAAYDSPIEIRLEEACTLRPQPSPVVQPGSLHAPAAGHLSPVDPRPRGPGLMITPAGFDVTRRAYSLAECGSAGLSPDFSGGGEGSVLEAAARRWSWQSGLPSAMPVLPSPSVAGGGGGGGGSYFGQAQAAVLTQPPAAYTGHFGVEGGGVGVARELSGDSFESACTPEASQVSSIFDSRSGSFSSAGGSSLEASTWAGGSGAEWTPTRSAPAQYVFGPQGLVDSPASMSPTRPGAVAVSPAQAFQLGSVRLGVPPLHLASLPITPGLGPKELTQARSMIAHAHPEPESPWSAGTRGPGGCMPPTPAAIAAHFASQVQTPLRAPVSSAFVTPTQQMPGFVFGTSGHAQLSAGASALPLEPAPALDGYNEV